MFLCLSKEQKQKCYKKCSIRKGVFKNFTIITGKHLCLSLFYLKLQRTCNLIKRSANACSEGVLRKIISDKNVMLSIFSQPEAAQKLQENNCTGVSFFIFIKGDTMV